jgi:hypothetical protein
MPFSAGCRIFSAPSARPTAPGPYGAKAFALGKPGADRYGDLKAIIGRTAALGLVISHVG